MMGLFIVFDGVLSVLVATPDEAFPFQAAFIVENANVASARLDRLESYRNFFISETEVQKKYSKHGSETKKK